MRRLPVLLLFLAAAALAALPAASRQSATPDDAKLRERAARLHREAIVVDTHNDITSALLDENFDLGARDTSGRTQTDIPRLKEGGLDAEFFAVYVAGKYAREGGAARRALEMIDVVYEQARRHPESLEMAFTTDDVRRVVKSGKIASLMGIEGGHAIEDSLGALRQFYRLGIRYMTLTHNNNNQLGRLLGRGAEAQRPDRLRQGGGPRDEPARDDGRHLARRRQDLLGRDRR